MRPGWRAHGAARLAAGFGPDRHEAPELPEPVREQLARAEIAVEEAHLAWELARLARLDGDDHLALTTLVLLSLESLARGSTRLAIHDRVALAERATTVLGMDAAITDRLGPLLDRAAAHADGDPLGGLFGRPGERRPLILEGPYLVHERLRAVEERLARRLSERIASALEVEGTGRADAESALQTLREHPARGPSGTIALTGEQEAAVAAALRSPLTVVSGGPGTGKTSIVVAILRAAVDALALDPSSVALAAPTGKAADRMRRSIEAGLLAIADPTAADRALLAALPEPRTLHRLLGFSPSRGTFRHHAQNPLSERLVVVDESSMIDVFLMERLVESLHPSARLVLLGDAEQLPSVAAGAVFRDLESAASITSVRLTRSHRMDPSRPEGFNILSVAARLNQGEMPPLALPKAGPLGIFPSEPMALGLLEVLPDAPDSLGGAFLLPLDGSEDRERFLDWWYAHRVRGPAAMQRLAARTWPREAGRVHDEGALLPLFELSERARLLCVTRSAARATGVEAVNAALHRRYADDAQAPVGLGLMLAGEPVLAHRNDYERGLFNGDQGIVLWTRSRDDDGPRPSAVFRRDDGLVAHPMEAVRGSLELGYATTVHKAQGSEHDAVALLLPETDSPRLLTREIVYTAVTRARRSVLILGSPAVLERAARRRIERSSGISERLRDATERDVP